MESSHHHFGMWTTRGYAGERKNNLDGLGGFTIQPLSERNNTQHDFCFLGFFIVVVVVFLFWILVYWNNFSNLARIGILCFILLMVQILFTVKLSSWIPSLFLMTLRNPSTYCKEKIRLQDILRCTDMLLVERWTCGRHVGGEEVFCDRPNCWRISFCRL